MSSTPMDFPEKGQPRGTKNVLDGYVLSEEERRLLRQCNNESFMYRSLPLSVICAAITKSLISRGILTASSRFGPAPKMVFAGFIGYVAGKMSYMGECQEKFKRLANSPLGEMLRQREDTSQQSSTEQSEMSDPVSKSYDTMFQQDESLMQRSYTPESPVQMGRADDFSAPVQSIVEEEEPTRKSILYEDLRLKNRENYEVTLTQKAETLLKTSPEKEPKRLKKEIKNIYGDTWDEN